MVALADEHGELRVARLAASGSVSGGAGCRVITEETQRGFLPSLGRLYIRGALHRNHQAWLEGLARMAATGVPA